jgi:copper chaperone NosL
MMPMMTRSGRTGRGLLLLVAALLLAACAAGPQAVHWGVEECAHCQMVISDERFAAQVVDRRGNTYKFDAIECMADFVNGDRLAAADLHSAWIAHGRDGWVNVTDAAFLHSDNTRSPMGGGYTAHADVAAARALQAEVGGRLLTWDELVARVAQTGHDHAGHERTGHVHAGHDHAGHDHAVDDHSGDGHGGSAAAGGTD